MQYYISIVAGKYFFFEIYNLHKKNIFYIIYLKYINIYFFEYNL